MYKLEFTLKQHTPLIHFQHEQEGATLRATEVKPKLDKFIIAKNGGLEKLLENHSDWFVGTGEHPALDYKLRITGRSSIKYVIANRLDEKYREAIDNSFLYVPESSFFAEEKNIGALFKKPHTKGDNPILKPEYSSLLGDISKQGIVNKDNERKENDIHVKIVSFCPGILGEIKNSINSFFLSENFGCRQNKGFGCFTVNEIEGKKTTCDVSSSLKEIFDYVYCKNCPGDFINAFSIIQKDYKLLKTGRGRKEGYAKSKLFLYFAKKNIRWEKRWIKQKYYETNPDDFPYKLAVDKYKSPTEPIDINLRNDWDDTKHPNNSQIQYQYIRALLGLAEHFEFQTNSEDKEKFVVQIGSEINTIQRIKSPISFKYIDRKIYLVANRLTNGEKSPLGRSIEFTFRMKDKQNKLLKDPYIPIPDPPPIPSSFDIQEFIDFAIKDKSDDAMVDGYIKI